MDPLEQSVNDELAAKQMQTELSDDPLANLGGDIVTPQQLAYRQEKEKYQSTQAALAAGAAGIARGLTFGVSDVILRGLGKAEEARKLEAYQPIYSTAGEIAGGVGGALLGGPGAALTRGAEAVTAGIARPAIRAATKEAIEGAVYGLGQTVSEQALGTPDSVAESLIANVGLGAVLGAPIGLGVHGLSEGAQALSKQVGKTLKGEGAINKLIGQTDEYFGDEFIKTAENIDELRKIAKERGVPLTQGMESDSDIMRGLESFLGQRPTVFGGKVREEVMPTYKAFQREASKIVEDASEETKDQVAERFKNELTTRVHSLWDPANSAYQKINQELDALTLTPDLREKFVGKIEKWIPDNTLKNSPARKAAQEAIDNFSELIDMPLRKVKEVATQLGQKGQNLKQTGFSDEAKKVFELQNKVNDFFDRSVRRAALEDTLNMPNGKQLAEEFIADYKGAKKGWKEFRSFMTEIGEEAGLGKVRSIDEFIRKVEGIDNDKLVKNIFNLKSPRTLEFFKANFPDIFEQFRKVEIAKLAAKTQAFDPRGNPITDVLKLSKELEKYKPEVASMILGPQKIQAITDLEKLYRKMPRKIGPSGTPEGLWYADLLKPAMWLTDMAVYGVYKTGKLALEIQEKQNSQIANHIKRFLTETKKTVVPASTIGVTSSFENYEKNLDYVQSIAIDPEKFSFELSENTKGLADIDPDLQQAISNTSVQAINFLQAKAPKNPFEGSMFQSKMKWKPSDAELSKFNRYLKAASDPFSILADLEQGVLTSEAVEAVQVVYPQIYQQIVTQTINSVGEVQDIPFAKQLQLSLLLNQPLTNAQDIQMMQRLQSGAQAAGQMEQAQQQAPKKTKKIEGDFLKGKMGQSEQLIRSRGE